MATATLSARPAVRVLSVRSTGATAKRVLTQLVRDRRTVAMLLVVPSLLMVLLRYVFDDQVLFNRIAPALLGVFPFIVMFLLTSVAMLRERTSGTLERLLTTPMAKADLLLGYGIAFAVAAAAQATVACATAYWLLDLTTQGSVGLLVLVAVADAILGMALGLWVSAFARTEFQAVQFMPAFVLPQVLLCGLLTPRDAMADWLEAISNVLPMSYAVDALNEVQNNSEVTSALIGDLAIVVGATVLALALAAATLRRRTA
ncbi:ABC transporter permease [Cryptosporangium aurantiacum]|uniref:Transport permease protein n=1 Tax=Cryptosporangium aurantiacum TaxID=134849 RepID=A0A1M7I815_9ACTN|nr:ABC transporter permease [Cryptosporangium aurantiacum]SHM36759.1 ABC-2 type transport system permease protein [Cryptosporangium aurantiacum]